MVLTARRAENKTDSPTDALNAAQVRTSRLAAAILQRRLANMRFGMCFRPYALGLMNFLASLSLKISIFKLKQLTHLRQKVFFRSTIVFKGHCTGPEMSSHGRGRPHDEDDLAVVSAHRPHEMGQRAMHHEGQAGEQPWCESVRTGARGVKRLGQWDAFGSMDSISGKGAAGRRDANYFLSRWPATDAGLRQLHAPCPARGTQRGHLSGCLRMLFVILLVRHADGWISLSDKGYTVKHSLVAQAGVKVLGEVGVNGFIISKPVAKLQCNPSRRGAIRWNEEQFEGCDGATNWRPLTFCSRSCDINTDSVPCGLMVRNRCDKSCNQEGTGLNMRQCILNVASTPCQHVVR